MKRVRAAISKEKRAEMKDLFERLRDLLGKSTDLRSNHEQAGPEAELLNHREVLLTLAANWLRKYADDNRSRLR